MNISQGGSDRAGEVLYLNCSVLKTINGLVHSPSAAWTVNREHIQEGDNINISVHETSISFLTFNPLKTSHTGNYSCHGNLTSPAQYLHRWSLFLILKEFSMLELIYH